MKFELLLIGICMNFFLHIPILSYSQTEFPPYCRSIELPLYENLTIILKQIQYEQDVSGSERLYLMDRINELAIHSYQLQDGDVSKYEYIEFPFEGPDGVQSSLTVGFYILSQDSIVLLVQNRLYIFNQNVEVLSKFNFKKDKPNNLEIPFINSGVGFPFSRADRKLLMTTKQGGSGVKGRRMGLTIDLLKEEAAWLISEKERDKSEWGTGDPLYHAVAVNLEDSNIVVAPTFSDEVFVLNLEGEIVKKLTLSTKNSPKKIKPIKTKKYDNNYSDIILMHYARQGFYYEMIYDKYQHLYYRTYFKKITDSTNPMDVFANQYIMIFDRNFNLLHDYKVPSKFKNMYMIPMTHGLCLLNEDQFDKNEEKFVFECFQFDK